MVPCRSCQSTARDGREDPSSHSQDSFQGFLVNRHLDRDVGKVVVHNLVWTWFNGGIVLGVLVVLLDGTNANLRENEGKIGA